MEGEQNMLDMNNMDGEFGMKGFENQDTLMNNMA